MPELAEAEDVDYLDLTDYEIQDSWVPKLLGDKISRKFDMLALEKNDNTLVVAMKDPKNIFAIDSAHLMTSMTIQPVMVDDELLQIKLVKSSPRKVKAPEPPPKAKKTNTDGALFRERIGQSFFQKEIDENQLDKPEIQRTTGMLLAHPYTGRFYHKDQLYKHLESQIGVSYINLEGIEIPEEIISLVSRKIVLKYHLIPVNLEDGVLTVA